jgi:hypothetical protein
MPARLKKSGHIHKRMRKFAKELKQFSTNDLSSKMNSQIMATNKKTKIKVSNIRLSSLLLGSQEIRKVGIHSNKGDQIWKWIGEEE